MIMRREIINNNNKYKTSNKIAKIILEVSLNNIFEAKKIATTFSKKITKHIFILHQI